jgi:hypothetical protein
VISRAPISPSAARSQVWLAFRIWLGGLIGFLVAAVVLLILGQGSAGGLFFGWMAIHLGNFFVWAWDLIRTRRTLALSMLLGLSIASVVAGLVVRDDLDSAPVRSGEFHW